MKFVVHATYVADPDRLAKLRPAHRQHAKGLVDTNALLLAGPMADGSGALFIYESETREGVEKLIASDPFSAAGCFASVQIWPWVLLGINHDRLQPSTPAVSAAGN